MKMSKFILIGLSVVCGVGWAAGNSEKQKMKKLTPILVVDQIEPSIKFWVDQLGFEMTMSVPEGDGAHFAFASVASGAVEIMYQTRSSIEKDMPKFAKRIGPPSTCLFIEVESLEDIERKLDGVEIVMAKRKTFYGSTEIGIREPGGHFVTFAEMSKDAPE